MWLKFRRVLFRSWPASSSATRSPAKRSRISVSFNYGRWYVFRRRSTPLNWRDVRRLPGERSEPRNPFSERDRNRWCLWLQWIPARRPALRDLAGKRVRQASSLAFPRLETPRSNLCSQEWESGARNKRAQEVGSGVVLDARPAWFVFRPAETQWRSYGAAAGHALGQTGRDCFDNWSNRDKDRRSLYAWAGLPPDRSPRRWVCRAPLAPNCRSRSMCRQTTTCLPGPFEFRFLSSKLRRPSSRLSSASHSNHIPWTDWLLSTSASLQETDAV